MNNTINLWVNGKQLNVEVAPGEMLSDVLRYQLGLTGTKIGCNENECGACTVVMDGKPVMSCSLPAMKAANKHVLTVEGLANGDELHPLQEAFVKLGATQCGFCTPGQLMTSYALLAKNPNPSEEEIKYALKDTLCRCGAYPAIVRAVQAAAEKIRTGKDITFPDLPESRDTRVIGHLEKARGNS